METEDLNNNNNIMYFVFEGKLSNQYLGYPAQKLNWVIYKLISTYKIVCRRKLDNKIDRYICSFGGGGVTNLCASFNCVRV